jgi:hypothetical protein
MSIHRVNRTDFHALAAFDAFCGVNDGFAVYDTDRIDLTNTCAPGAAVAFVRIDLQIRPQRAHAAAKAGKRQTGKQGNGKDQLSFISHRLTAPNEHTEKHRRHPVQVLELMIAFWRKTVTDAVGHTRSQSRQPTQR